MHCINIIGKLCILMCVLVVLHDVANTETAPLQHTNQECCKVLNYNRFNRISQLSIDSKHRHDSVNIAKEKEVNTSEPNISKSDLDVQLNYQLTTYFTNISQHCADNLQQQNTLGLCLNRALVPSNVPCISSISAQTTHYCRSTSNSIQSIQRNGIKLNPLCCSSWFQRQQKRPRNRSVCCFQCRRDQNGYKRQNISSSKSDTLVFNCDYLSNSYARTKRKTNNVNTNNNRNDGKPLSSVGSPNRILNDVCPPNCKGGCNPQTSHCTTCIGGYHGPYCNQSCDIGFYGSQCLERCPPLCLGQKCHPISGHCFDCNPGYIGDFCNVKCIIGYYGNQCKDRCSEMCLGQLCDFRTGECDKCLPGYYGPECNTLCPSATYGPKCMYTCSKGCKSECDRATGACLECQVGFAGALCNETCPKGFYGVDCATPCPSGCFNDECDFQDGKCFNCKTMLQGLFCRENVSFWLANLTQNIVYIREKHHVTDNSNNNQQLLIILIMSGVMVVVFSVFLVGIFYLVKTRTRRQPDHPSRQKRSKEARDSAGQSHPTNTRYSDSSGDEHPQIIRTVVEQRPVNPRVLYDPSVMECNFGSIPATFIRTDLQGIQVISPKREVNANVPQLGYDNDPQKSDSCECSIHSQKSKTYVVQPFGVGAAGSQSGMSLSNMYTSTSNSTSKSQTATRNTSNLVPSLTTSSTGCSMECKRHTVKSEPSYSVLRNESEISFHSLDKRKSNSYPRAIETGILRSPKPVIARHSTNSSTSGVSLDKPVYKNAMSQYESFDVCCSSDDGSYNKAHRQNNHTERSFDESQEENFIEGAGYHRENITIGAVNQRVAEHAISPTHQNRIHLHRPSVSENVNRRDSMNTTYRPNGQSDTLVETSPTMEENIRNEAHAHHNRIRAFQEKLSEEMSFKSSNTANRLPGVQHSASVPLPINKEDDLIDGHSRSVISIKPTNAVSIATETPSGWANTEHIKYNESDYQQTRNSSTQCPSQRVTFDDSVAHSIGSNHSVKLKPMEDSVSFSKMKVDPSNILALFHASHSIDNITSPERNNNMEAGSSNDLSLPSISNRVIFHSNQECSEVSESPNKATKKPPPISPRQSTKKEPSETTPIIKRYSPGFQNRLSLFENIVQTSKQYQSSIQGLKRGGSFNADISQRDYSHRLEELISVDQIRGSSSREIKPLSYKDASMRKSLRTVSTSLNDINKVDVCPMLHEQMSRLKATSHKFEGGISPRIKRNTERDYRLSYVSSAKDMEKRSHAIEVHRSSPRSTPSPKRTQRSPSFDQKPPPSPRGRGFIQCPQKSGETDLSPVSSPKSTHIISKDSSKTRRNQKLDADDDTARTEPIVSLSVKPPEFDVDSTANPTSLQEHYQSRSIKISETQDHCNYQHVIRNDSILSEQRNIDASDLHSPQKCDSFMSLLDNDPDARNCKRSPLYWSESDVLKCHDMMMLPNNPETSSSTTAIMWPTNNFSDQYSQNIRPDMVDNNMKHSVNPSSLEAKHCATENSKDTSVPKSDENTLASMCVHSEMILGQQIATEDINNRRATMLTKKIDSHNMFVSNEQYRKNKKHDDQYQEIYSCLPLINPLSKSCESISNLNEISEENVVTFNSSTSISLQANERTNLQSIQYSHDSPSPPKYFIQSSPRQHSSLSPIRLLSPQPYKKLSPEQMRSPVKFITSISRSSHPKSDSCVVIQMPNIGTEESTNSQIREYKRTRTLQSPIPNTISSMCIENDGFGRHNTNRPQKDTETHISNSTQQEPSSNKREQQNYGMLTFQNQFLPEPKDRLSLQFKQKETNPCILRSNDNGDIQNEKQNVYNASESVATPIHKIDIANNEKDQLKISPDINDFSEPSATSLNSNNQKRILCDNKGPEFTQEQCSLEPSTQEKECGMRTSKRKSVTTHKKRVATSPMINGDILSTQNVHSDMVSRLLAVLSEPKRPIAQEQINKSTVKVTKGVPKVVTKARKRRSKKRERDLSAVYEDDDDEDGGGASFQNVTWTHISPQSSERSAKSKSGALPVCLKNSGSPVMIPESCSNSSYQVNSLAKSVTLMSVSSLPSVPSSVMITSPQTSNTQSFLREETYSYGALNNMKSEPLPLYSMNRTDKKFVSFNSKSANQSLPIPLPRSRSLKRDISNESRSSPRSINKATNRKSPLANRMSRVVQERYQTPSIKSFRENNAFQLKDACTSKLMEALYRGRPRSLSREKAYAKTKSWVESTAYALPNLENNHSPLSLSLSPRQKSTYMGSCGSTSPQSSRKHVSLSNQKHRKNNKGFDEYEEYDEGWEDEEVKREDKEKQKKNEEEESKRKLKRMIPGRSPDLAPLLFSSANSKFQRQSSQNFMPKSRSPIKLRDPNTSNSFSSNKGNNSRIYPSTSPMLNCPKPIPAPRKERSARLPQRINSSPIPAKSNTARSSASNSSFTRAKLISAHNSSQIASPRWKPLVGKASNEKEHGTIALTKSAWPRVASVDRHSKPNRQSQSHRFVDPSDHQSFTSATTNAISPTGSGSFSDNVLPAYDSDLERRGKKENRSNSATSQKLVRVVRKNRRERSNSVLGIRHQPREIGEEINLFVEASKTRINRLVPKMKKLGAKVLDF